MIGEIEDAVKAALSASDMGSYCKTIETYQGDFDDALEDLIVRFPAVLVVYLRSEFKRRAMGRQLKTTETALFSIFVASSNLRSERARRRGGPEMIGTYQMTRDVIEVLFGKTLGLDITPIDLKRVSSIDQTKDASCYAIEITTSFTTSESVVDEGDLTSVHLRYHIPPDAEEPKAEDTVEFTE